MIDEFKKFAMRGNVIDLAVGVVIGGAFGKIVDSLVGDILMPIVGVLTGGINFSGLSFTVGSATLAYGKFIQATIVFVIVAFALFVLIKAINTMKKKEDEAPHAPAKPSAEVELLTQIRDSLKK
jgi:large conductance mechanosensitive channel